MSVIALFNMGSDSVVHYHLSFQRVVHPGLHPMIHQRLVHEQRSLRGHDQRGESVPLLWADADIHFGSSWRKQSTSRRQDEVSFQHCVAASQINLKMASQGHNTEQLLLGVQHLLDQHFEKLEKFIDVRLQFPQQLMHMQEEEHPDGISSEAEEGSKGGVRAETTTVTSVHDRHFQWKGTSRNDLQFKVRLSAR